MLIDKLFIEIHEHIRQTLREPEIVVMHPETSKDIFSALKINGMPHTDLHIRGYKVLRSEDVPKNEFIIK